MEFKFNVVLLTDKELKELKKVVLDGMIYHKRNMIDSNYSTEEIRDYSLMIKKLLKRFDVKGEEE